MDIDPDEIVNVELRWDNGGCLLETYSRNITRRQLGELLLRLDDMAAVTEGVAESAEEPFPEVEFDLPPRCEKCRQIFDEADTRFDGFARKDGTPFCRRCTDACHDTEIADHWCAIDEWRVSR